MSPTGAVGVCRSKLIPAPSCSDQLSFSGTDLKAPTWPPVCPFVSERFVVPVIAPLVPPEVIAPAGGGADSMAPLTIGGSVFACDHASVLDIENSSIVLDEKTTVLAAIFSIVSSSCLSSIRTFVQCQVALTCAPGRVYSYDAINVSLYVPHMCSKAPVRQLNRLRRLS